MKEKIEAYTQKKSEFIDKVRRVFDNTVDLMEKKNRLEVFDNLLLAATWKEIADLDLDIALMLPAANSNATINYIIQQLREINGFCTASFSDNHEAYQDLFQSLAFPTSETKQNVRVMLQNSMVTMILNQTNTLVTETNTINAM